MTQISIILSESLTNYLQSQIAAGRYATPSDYIQDLIQQDQARKAHLESLMLEALDSPASPMTQTDWDTIRSAVRQKLSQDHSNG
ncbi:ribbon-helix-helix domain-containing protein [Leptolyngbya sp. AN03gr2]|uniref:ribbon-helix-helix domain-containing protein n=1 Tax=unclassified Leptolyngbya TaxID=2650499 RepID=UPI003D3158F3